MNFFNKLKSSVYNPKFYLKIRTMGLWSVIGYFFLLIFALTIINGFLLSYDLLSKAPAEIRNGIDEVVRSYPAELEVDIKDGKVSTNVNEPFFIPFPQGESQMNKERLNNILVIDTKTGFSAAQFDQYKTLLWLTSDSLFYKNNGVDQRSINLSEVKDFKINKEVINGYLEKLEPLYKFVGPGLLIISLIGMFIGFSFSLVYFFFLAALIFLLSGIFKWGLNYSTAYKTAVFSSTLSFIVDLILFNTGYYTGFYGFPFFFTLTALCVTTINLQNFQEKS